MPILRLLDFYRRTRNGPVEKRYGMEREQNRSEKSIISRKAKSTNAENLIIGFRRPTLSERNNS
jgi:hypothetical protein